MDKEKYLNHKNQQLASGYSEEAVINDIWDTAYQHGRESLLRAAQDLVDSWSVLDDKADTEAARGRQALDSLRFLNEWVEMEPGVRRYDVGMDEFHSTGLKYRITVWTREFNNYDRNYKVFRGNTALDALANAAQSVVAEVEEARSRK